MNINGLNTAVEGARKHWQRSLARPSGLLDVDCQRSVHSLEWVPKVCISSTGTRFGELHSLDGYLLQIGQFCPSFRTHAAYPSRAGSATNPRETKAFVIGNRAGKWLITSVQIGNNFAHTLRDRSQAQGTKKGIKNRVLMDFHKNGSFSIRNEWSPIRQSDLIEGSQEWRIPAHFECS